MNILFPVSEAAPLYKIGGLGDVAGSLPKALTPLGHDVRIALPRHPQITIDLNTWHELEHLDVVYDHHVHPVTIWQGTLPQSTVPVYLFENSTYLSSPSDASDNAIDKFVFFSKAVVTWLEQTTWHPHIIHLHDWHVAIIPLLLKHSNLSTMKQFNNLTIPHTLLTIHNIAYQGFTPTHVLDKLGISRGQSQILDWDADNGDIDILMEGILHADLVNTVSPTYAQEILTPEFGYSLDPILQARRGRLSGILNGIDVWQWNPATDSALTQQYDHTNWLEGKAANKLSLQQELNLPTSPTDPTHPTAPILIGFIGRLDRGQKGIDLLLEAAYANQLPKPGQQVVLLGTGDPGIEHELRQLDERLPDWISILKFDSQLARRMYAACDLMLIPSKYEPCGLVQMIAMRYGTIPVVRKTGGLADTVHENQTGFLFDNYDWPSLVAAIDTACIALRDPDHRRLLIETAMHQDFSWDTAAREYDKLYIKLMTEN